MSNHLNPLVFAASLGLVAHALFLGYMTWELARCMLPSDIGPRRLWYAVVVCMWFALFELARIFTIGWEGL